MPAMMLTNPALDKMVTYLTKCGGVDNHSFYDVEGKPDFDAARKFAQQLREQLEIGFDGNAPVKVEASTNRVIISLRKKQS